MKVLSELSESQKADALQCGGRESSGGDPGAHRDAA